MTVAAKLVALFLLLSAAGCSFSRAIVNPHHARHDTSWIVIGKTTRADVVERLGMPPGEIGGRSGVKGDTMRWVTSDAFTCTLEAGWLVTPTFEVSRERHQHDLLVAFDSSGVVTLVSRSERVNGVNRVLEFREAR